MAQKKKKNNRKPGEGTLFQRKDGRWQASFILETGRRKYVYGKTSSEALEKLRKAQEEDKKGILATGPRQRVGDYLLQWLESTHRPPMVRHSTYVQYRSAINKHLVPGLGHVFLHQLTAQQIQSFYSKKLQEGLKPGSISVIHGVLHKALETAVKWNLISRNVASLVNAPRRNPQEIYALSSDDAKKLIQAARESNIEALLIIAVTTGMRRGEILGLRWSDIDLDHGLLYIRRTLNRISGFGFIENDPKTKASRRKILLPDIAVAALERHRTKQEALKHKAASQWREKNLVFSNTVGNFINPDHLLTRFRRVLVQADLPMMRFHDLRHSAATILLVLGVHPKVVQELLGHSTIAMTMDTYSHLLPSMQKEAMGKMNDIFEQSSIDVTDDVNHLPADDDSN